MLDFDISKMAVVGVVALVVLGPERLPRVSRTVGTLIGRAQRYIGDVQKEVERQIELDDVRKMKTDIEKAVSGVQSSIQDTARKHATEIAASANNGVQSIQEAVHDSLPSIHDAGSKFEFAPWQADAAEESRPSPIRRSRIKRRVTTSGGFARVGAKRSRVVSMAASKALGRSHGRAG
ncbi:MAG: sec-independent protein translocase protein TatB [Paraburkholderia sp.]|nr:sec-independent protein translocase protein TatB [Paraburkholderia sp.]